MSRRTGVNVETVRYYERIGLLPPPPRTRNGRRSYGTDSLQTLAFIKRGRELGFRIDDIRALLALRNAPCCIDVKSVAGRHLEDVRAKMRTLSRLEHVLATTLERCPGDTSSACPVLDVLELGEVAGLSLAP